MKKNKMEIKVWLDKVNFWGEVESTLVAQFRTMGWAQTYINQLKEDYEDDMFKIRVEVCE